MNPTASRLLLVAALLLAVLAGAGGIRLASALQPAVVDAAPPVPAGTRPGDVLAATELRTVSADEVRAILADAGFAPPSPARAVRLTRVAYASLDPSDAVVPATGLVAVPEPGTPPLVPAVHLHGSALNRGAVPCQAASPFLYGPALALASRGYAAVLPDYLGLGGAPGRHPYLQHRSEAQSAVDLLLAARTLLAEQGTALDDEVLVSGFSQGGSAALSLARQLSSDASRFRPLAVAAIAGPHAIADAQLPAMLAGDLDPRSSAIYLAYLFTAWNEPHQLYDSPAELFRQPWANHVEGLFDGGHAELAVVLGLPGRPERLLTDRGLDLLRHPSGGFAAGIADADDLCRSWATAIPVLLLASPADEQFAFANTTTCGHRLTASGARNVTTIDLPPPAHRSGHLGSALTGLDVVVERWVELRPASA